MIHERENIVRPDYEVKRRKLQQPQGISAYEKGTSIVATRGNETLLDINNGTITPFHVDQQTEDIEMMESSSIDECPCGKFHGPGQGGHDDLTAVGLSDFPLLCGPE